MQDPNDPKTLRSNILAARNSLSTSDIEIKSKAILRRLLNLSAIKDANSIFIYVSFRSEVSTIELIDTLIKMEKRVIVPISRVKERHMDAIHISDRLTDLEPGYCNIPEPKADLFPAKAVPVQEIETIIQPGSVFDERGGRFGYGGGFYDRFVSKVPEANRIGLAFDLQIVEKAPLQPHDELLDLVVTESRVIRGDRK